MVSVEEVTWETCVAARSELQVVESLLGADRYREWSTELKSFLCSYFSADRPCTQKQGKSISPVASGVREGKGLKVRFGFPGCGKSGGLRLAVLAFCERRVVKIAGAWRRKEDPEDEDFRKAFDRSAT